MQIEIFLTTRLLIISYSTPVSGNRKNANRDNLTSQVLQLISKYIVFKLILHL